MQNSLLKKLDIIILRKDQMDYAVALTSAICLGIQIFDNRFNDPHLSVVQIQC